MGSGLLGLVVMVLFWSGVAALAVWLVRSLFPQAEKLAEQVGSRELNAREILDRRYARGEINREEYDVMKETLAD